MVVKNNKIKGLMLLVALLVAVIIPKPKLNAYTTAPNTEIVYFDYKGIYLTPNDYKNGVALTYEQYYEQAFGQYVNTGVTYFRLGSDYVKVMFIPMNYIEVEGFSGVGIDKLEMFEVGYQLYISTYDLINAITLDRVLVYTRSLDLSYSYVDKTNLSSMPVTPINFINGMIGEMPNIETEHQAIYDGGYDAGYYEGNRDGFDDGYDDGYSDGTTDGYDDGYSDGTTDGYDVGFIEAVSSVYYDGFGGFINPDTNELYDVTYSFPYGLGYSQGESDGIASNSDFSFTGLLFQIFNGMGGILAIELLPNITIGALVAVPVVFGIIYFIIGKRGGE